MPFWMWIFAGNAMAIVTLGPVFALYATTGLVGRTKAKSAA